MYVWWTCNQKCTYCIEFPYMEKSWKKVVTKYSILKNLIKYKQLGYNHVTYLWGEPFIQPVFRDALLLWKKLWFKILVTTNATTLHIDKQASKFLPYIDELILSVEALDKETQQKISRTKVVVDWENVFNNINKYWRWEYLKANIVVTNDNLYLLSDIVYYLNEKWIKEIAITYPDLNTKYYTQEHILEKVAPKYSLVINEVLHIIDFCNTNGINLKLPDFPFCVLPSLDLIKLTDDYDYESRVKITTDENKLDRKDLNNFEFVPRYREHWVKCNSCLYKKQCWWYPPCYGRLYWLSEINPIMSEKIY